MSRGILPGMGALGSAAPGDRRTETMLLIFQERERERMRMGSKWQFPCGGRLVGRPSGHWKLQGNHKRYHLPVAEYYFKGCCFCLGCICLTL